MKNEHRKQDFLFIKFFLLTFDLSRVLRWRNRGQKKFHSLKEMQEMKEDDLQHSASMMVLAKLLIQKAIAEGDLLTSTLSVGKIVDMVFGHDASEIIVGDSRQKTSVFREVEKEADLEVNTVIAQLNFGHLLLANRAEYHAKLSHEARFVKALDEIQAWFYLVYLARYDESSRNFEELESIVGYQFAIEFPTLERIARILLRLMRSRKLKHSLRDM